MAFFLLLILLCFISGQRTLPVEDVDAAVIITDDLDLNAIDGTDSDINLSHLGSEAYGIPREENGVAVANWTESSLANPEEMSGYAEGDILMPHLSRNGVSDSAWQWPDGIIYYVIDKTFNRMQQDIIMSAMEDYHQLTCIRFVPHSGQEDYIIIKSSNTGCWSSIGRTGGRQRVNLQIPGCISKKGTVLHELLHTVGFLHEQSRPERDDFVNVLYQNIRPGLERNFKKADPNNTNDFGISYDYNSVMHYSEYAFSKNSQKTIDPKIEGVKLGQRDGLSRGDVKKINNMYNCSQEEPQSGWIGEVWQP